jgi:hypothetical protein
MSAYAVAVINVLLPNTTQYPDAQALLTAQDSQHHSHPHHLIRIFVTTLSAVPIPMRAMTKQSVGDEVAALSLWCGYPKSVVRPVSQSSHRLYKFRSVATSGPTDRIGSRALNDRLHSPSCSLTDLCINGTTDSRYAPTSMYIVSTDLPVFIVTLGACSRKPHRS